MRTLAIDLGNRRVGLALSDEGARFATPHDVLQVKSPEDALAPILKLIEQEEIRRVVVGLPVNMDDTIGPAAEAAMKWGRDLAAHSQVEIIYVDERLTSFAAEQRLADRKKAGAKMTRGQKKQMLDAHAAAGFLQEFLDGKLIAIEV